MGSEKKKAPLSYKEAWERRRAEYWFSVAKFLLSLTGGIIGAIIAFLLLGD
ncbi:MAG: hypothetical protein IJX50_00130 [Clostridia bacterium]|nr:hypothetical protein [Clostridia bacterium]